jgi:glycosyltransferase involved in cell wall biosynthesis
MLQAKPRLLVYSHLFPSDVQPNAGLFIRERMFRVAKHIPIVVVAPQPWFPFQHLIRRFRPHFRPMAVRYEVQQGIGIHRPRFVCFPGVLKWTDGLFLALSSYLTVRRLLREHQLNILDAHFGYPDGYAAKLLARWLGLPLMLTLRGKEERQMRTDVRVPLVKAICGADRVICVSEALRQVAIHAGANPDRTIVIGNGVDLQKFHRVPQADARRELGLPADAQVLVSVGALVERKGYHRVIECLPAVLRRFPNLHYLIVGGAGPEGDFSTRLREQVAAAGLKHRVHFLGALHPTRLKVPLSASDIFVLATSYEGWANVFLEAMACGLPIISTKVGGNAQVVNATHLGCLVALGDREALTAAITEALEREWDRERIVAYAQVNTWDSRVGMLLDEFSKLIPGASGLTPSRADANAALPRHT